MLWMFVQCQGAQSSLNKCRSKVLCAVSALLRPVANSYVKESRLPMVASLSPYESLWFIFSIEQALREKGLRISYPSCFRWSNEARLYDLLVKAIRRTGYDLTLYWGVLPLLKKYYSSDVVSRRIHFSAMLHVMRVGLFIL